MATTSSPLANALESAQTSDGVSLAELSRRSPALVVFLRHSGCAFSREVLTDVARQRAAIEASGTKIVVVHMDEPARFAALAARFGLGDIVHVSDPSQTLYRAFELRRGSLAQVMGLSVIWRGLKYLLSGKGSMGVPRGDVFQLPGAFLIHDSQIVRAFRHETSADRPDYCALSRTSGSL